MIFKIFKKKKKKVCALQSDVFIRRHFPELPPSPFRKCSHLQSGWLASSCSFLPGTHQTLSKVSHSKKDHWLSREKDVVGSNASSATC